MSEKEFPTYAIGLMSGTSADGVDGVVLEFSSERDFSIRSTQSIGYPKEVKDKIRRLVERKIINGNQTGNLGTELAQLYAEVIPGLLWELDRNRISVIGCHGQTVHHSPESSPPFSLQIGDGPELAKLTKIPVVTDFRSADLEAGGQGAPLAPAFHQAAFSSRVHNRSIVNIGGIANITILPADKKYDVLGFDTGPGNTLMDYWCRSRFDCEYDKDGEIANGGTIQFDLLDILLNDAYFEKSPPKSTGLEVFHAHWLNGKFSLWEGYHQSTNVDILTTLTALTARTIANQLNDLKPELDTVYLCGGGAKNTLLTALIKQQVTIKVETTAVLGIDPQWIEAAAFAWMAYRTLHGLTSTLPSVTGASKPTVAGVISFP